MSVFLSRKDRFLLPTPEPGGAYPFRVGRKILSKDSSLPVCAHMHEEIELIAVLSGQLSLLVNGNELSLTAGEGILINGSRIHAVFPPELGECELICVMLHPSLLGTNTTLVRELVEPRLKDPRVPYLKLRSDRFAHREIYEKIKWIHRMAREPMAPLWLMAAAAEIWANFCEHTEDTPSAHGRSTDDARAAAAMMTYVREHCAERMTLPAIAASAEMGQSKCCKLFAAYLKETPIEYLTRCRLEKSARLLSDTSLTVHEIANACGFAGGSYFAEAFHAHCGLTPTAYRKEYKK